MKAEGWMWTRGRPTSCFRVFLTTHFVRQQFTYPIENILICGTNTQQQLWGENLWPQLDVWHIYCALATVYNIVNISNSIKLVLPIKKASPVATQVLHVWDYDSLFWLFYGEFYSFRKLIVIMRLENRKYREFPTNLSYFRISIRRAFFYTENSNIYQYKFGEFQMNSPIKSRVYTDKWLSFTEICLQI